MVYAVPQTSGIQIFWTQPSSGVSLRVSFFMVVLFGTVILSLLPPPPPPVHAFLTLNILLFQEAEYLKIQMIIKTVGRGRT